jgi:hypothetical protein
MLVAAQDGASTSATVTVLRANARSCTINDSCGQKRSDGTFKIKDEAQKAMAPDAIGKTHDAAITHVGTHVGPKCDPRKCPTEKTGRKAGLLGPSRRISVIMPLAQSRLGVDFLGFLPSTGES